MKYLFRQLTIGLLCLALSPACVFAGITITLDDRGLAVDGGQDVHYTIEYPVLIGADGKQRAKIIEKIPGGGVATVKYEGGAQLEFIVSSEGVLDYAFSGVPDDVKYYEFTAYINFNYSHGGKWKMGASSEQPFPLEQPEKAHLYQAEAPSFTLINEDGNGLKAELPPFTYNQLTDNREWNWKIFVWKFHPLYNADHPNGRITFSLSGPAAEGTVIPTPVKVDEFGQSTKMDWPDKLKSEAELKADAELEKEYYASLNPPAFDKYGGLPGSGEKLGLSKTGFFHVEKKGEKWILVDPEGNAFFHLGLGCFTTYAWTYIKGREDIYAWLPELESEYKTAFVDAKDPDSFSFYAANYIKKFGKHLDDNEYSLRMIERVRKLGFNSSGPFTKIPDQSYRQANFPYVLSTPLAPWHGIPFLPGIGSTWDPFEEKNIKRLDEVYAAKLPARANDPLLIGYFLENEPLYEDIPRVVPGLKGKYACKLRLVSMLLEKYVTIEAFNKAWGLDASSFDELKDNGIAVNTAQASRDMQEYTHLFLDTYYQIITRTFRKYDKNHLILGNRLQYGTINNRQLCNLMAKYVDVVSFNYYTYGVDKAFLEQIYRWTGEKPMILSEFYWGAPKESGLPGGVKDVGTQEERGLAYRNYVEQSAVLGFVIGVEWFTLIDESFTGQWFSKYTGENGNTGIFAVSDRPWKKMLEHAVKTNYRIYDVALNGEEPFVYDSPLFTLTNGGQKSLKIPRTQGPITIDGAADGWPGIPAEEFGNRLVHGSSIENLNASFKACWDDRNLYLLMSIADSSPMKNIRTGGDIWMGDAVEIFTGPEQLDLGGPLLFSDRHIMLSAGTVDGKTSSYVRNTAEQTPCELAIVPAVDGKGYTIEAAIPFAALGFKPEDGQEIRFDLGLDDSVDGKLRTRQLMWNGVEKNAADRGGWGRAVFLR